MRLNFLRFHCAPPGKSHLKTPITRECICRFIALGAQRRLRQRASELIDTTEMDHACAEILNLRHVAVTSSKFIASLHNVRARAKRSLLEIYDMMHPSDECGYVHGVTPRALSVFHERCAATILRSNTRLFSEEGNLLSV
jgi:hypothetical protein